MESLSSSLTNFHSLNFSFLFSKFFQFTVFTDKMAIEAFHVASIGYIWASLVAQTVKCLTAMRETRGHYLGREYPLEEVMATHSSIHSCLENSMGKGAWLATVHGVTKSWTGLPLFILLGI